MSETSKPAQVGSNEGLGVSQIEAAIIAGMMNVAEPYGLCGEVKDAYDKYRSAGDPPSTAAMCALYDWDL